MPDFFLCSKIIMMIYTSLRKHFFLFFHASCMLNKNTHYSLSQCSILLFLKICFMKAQWTQELGFQMRQKDKKISDIWYLSLSRILVQHESRTVAYSSQGDILAVNSPVCSLTVVVLSAAPLGGSGPGSWVWVHREMDGFDTNEGHL